MREIKLASTKNVTVFQTDTVEEILMLMFGVSSKEELENYIFEGENYETKEPVNVKYEELLKSVTNDGCYSIADIDTKSIFIWADFTKVNTITFFNLIGQELAHLEEPYLGEKEEEIKAKLFGEITACAYEIYEKVSK